MQNMQLSHAWAQWWESCQESNRMGQLVAAALHRVQGVQLPRA